MNLDQQFKMVLFIKMQLLCGLQFSYPNNAADVNSIIRSSGRTSLHVAVEKKFTSGVQFLLERPDIMVRNLLKIRQWVNHSGRAHAS